METFIELKELVVNPHYEMQRKKKLAGLIDKMIDAPIVHLINCLNKLRHCFTLQCCYGHFLYNRQQEPYNIDPLPKMSGIDRVEYKIAYIALCVENSEPGVKFLETLKAVTLIDPKNIQYGCAEWFWKQQVNSYVLQVEPDRIKYQDRALLDYKEALYIETIRNEFFKQLNTIMQKVGF